MKPDGLFSSLSIVWLAGLLGAAVWVLFLF
jgi:hypothetical protein